MYEPTQCRICHAEIPGRHPSAPKLTLCESCARQTPTASLIRAPAPAAPQGPVSTPPPGKAPLRTIDEWEKLSQQEQLARMDEVDHLLAEGQR
jgi:hypothetical protein